MVWLSERFHLVLTRLLEKFRLVLTQLSQKFRLVLIRGHPKGVVPVVTRFSEKYSSSFDSDYLRNDSTSFELALSEKFRQVLVTGIIRKVSPSFDSVIRKVSSSFDSVIGKNFV